MGLFVLQCKHLIVKVGRIVKVTRQIQEIRNVIESP